MIFTIQNNSLGTYFQIAHGWMPQNRTNENPTLRMLACHEAAAKTAQCGEDTHRMSSPYLIHPAQFLHAKRFRYALAWLINIFPEWQYVFKERKPCISYKPWYYVCYSFAAPGNEVIWPFVCPIWSLDCLFKIIKTGNKEIRTLRRYWPFVSVIHWWTGSNVFPAIFKPFESYYSNVQNSNWIHFMKERLFKL